MVYPYQNNTFFQTARYPRLPVTPFLKNQSRTIGLFNSTEPDYSKMTLREELEYRLNDMKRQQREKQQSTIYRTYHPNHNHLKEKQRRYAINNNIPIRLEIQDNPEEDPTWPLQHSPSLGNFYVNRYNNIIDKYAKKYGVDPDLPKAVMYTEAATGHKFGGNILADIFKISDSQMPMNIQGKLWGHMDGQYYDTYDPEQNIELGIKLLNRIYNAVPDHNIAKIGTLWNFTGADKVNHVGAHIKYNYDNKFWDSNKMKPQLIER